jgi:cytoskeletal protein CcmA (bactofilin family)
MPDVRSEFPTSPSLEATRTVLGPSVTLRGELTADEDLAIEGQFDGTIHLRDHCVTVGPEGQVKAEIQTSRVVVLGSVTGNITARERIEIRKTGSVMGDLVAPSIAIEDGAYFKGSIEILREAELPASPSRAFAAAAEPDPDELLAPEASVHRKRSGTLQGED